MIRFSADQIATILSSLLAIALVLLGALLIERKQYWALLLVVPLLAGSGLAIYYFGFYRFTRLF
jgi:hypothetical protein